MSNVLRTVISFVTGVLIARSLGAASYGQLNFLLGSFAAVNLVLDVGTSPAFYTLLSRRPRGPLFYGLYFAWTIGVQFFGTVLIVAFVLPSSAINEIWLGENLTAILLAFAASFATSQVWNTVIQIGEAARLTLVVQTGTVIQAVVHLALIAIAMAMGKLDILTVFVFLLCEYLVIALVLGFHVYERTVDRNASDGAVEIFSEFLEYCRPFALYGLVGFVYAFADRWLLQNFGGSEQQGFFAVGQQFATLSLLATTSILNVLWKEVAESLQRNDVGRTAYLFSTVRRSLFFFASWVSCMLLPYVAEILTITVGHEFQPARIPTALMLLYPIHQAVGQIQGTFLLASGKTKTHTRIGIATMLVSLPITWFVLARRSSFVPGIEAGVTGLVVKMLLLQLLGVGAQAVVIERMSIARRDFSYQAAIVGSLLITSFAMREAIRLLLPNVHPYAAGALGCAAYCAATLLLVLKKPSLAGIQPKLWNREGRSVIHGAT